MILVTLGTHPVPMDRLLRRLDDFVADRQIHEEVVVQTPALHYVPKHLTVHEIVPFEELKRMVREATAVVSHAGPGNLAVIRGEGKVPVVVPRSPAFHEHVDDHQQRYGRRLRDLPGYIVVDDLDELPSAIARAADAAITEISPPTVEEAVELLRRIIRCP